MKSLLTLKLARALLADCPTKNPYNLTIKGKLRNLAHRHGRSRDADDDWAEAQRIVARQGLEYLMRLQPQ